MLSVTNLSVAFATEHGMAEVLDGVNLKIARGEVMGLAGESGCGKTTLARAILGVLPPSAKITSGKILFEGHNLLERSPRQLTARFRGSRVSFIPQDPYGSFNPVFTVGAQIMELMKWKSPLLERPDLGGTEPKARRLPPLLQAYPKARFKADKELVLQALRDVQIPRPELALRKLPHEFSGGQRQRLMIGMALLPQPDLIIADEPTTALDVTIQAQILVLLRNLVKTRDISVLFTTHDLGTAYEICDRITVMYAGQEMESAGTDTFFENPSHPYTARLLECLPKADKPIQDIPGAVPTLIRPPGGCRFHPRCREASDRCREARPPRQEIGQGHYLRCFHPVGRQDAATGQRVEDGAA